MRQLVDGYFRYPPPKEKTNKSVLFCLNHNPRIHLCQPYKQQGNVICLSGAHGERRSLNNSNTVVLFSGGLQKGTPDPPDPAWSEPGPRSRYGPALIWKTPAWSV